MYIYTFVLLQLYNCIFHTFYILQMFTFHVARPAFQIPHSSCLSPLISHFSSLTFHIPHILPHLPSSRPSHHTFCLATLMFCVICIAHLSNCCIKSTIESLFLPLSFHLFFKTSAIVDIKNIEHIYIYIYIYIFIVI